MLLIQLAVVVVAAGGLYGRGHLWYGLPTIDMVLAFNNLLVDARETIQSYSARHRRPAASSSASAWRSPPVSSSTTSR